MRKRTCLALGVVGLVGLVGLGSCDRFFARNPEYCTSNADCADKGAGREVCNLTLNRCGESAGPASVSRLDPTASSSTSGVRVSVLGQGFLPGMSVLVNGTAVETEYRSATELSFLAPPGKVCSRLDITVQTAEGVVLTGSLSFRYKAQQPAFTSVVKTNWAAMARGIEAADFTGDGASDIYYVNHVNAINQLDIYSKATPDYVPSGYNLQGAYDRVKVLGFNGQGGADFVAWRADGFVIVKVAAGAPSVGLPMPVTTLGGLAVAPINANDALNDIVVIENTVPAGQLVIYINKSTTTFEQQSSSLSLAGVGKALVTGDFDNNGKTDLVVALDPNRSLQSFSGNGDGTFLPGREVRTPFQASLLAVADA